jgi:branched-chain amino acid aminotransferase
MEEGNMPKKDLDWGNIGFSYIPTDKRYVANYKDGQWGEGTLTSDSNVVISECAGILQYCQECFEGLKAYTTEDGSIVTFRPDLNADRMKDSAERLEMPPISKEQFLEAVDAVVKANADWVPPYGSGATLYIIYVCVRTSNRSKTIRSVSVPYVCNTSRPLL